MSESIAELRAEVRKLREIVYRLEGNAQPPDERRVRLARMADGEELAGHFKDIIFLTGNADDRSSTPTTANVLTKGQFLAFEQGGQWFIVNGGDCKCCSPCDLLDALEDEGALLTATVDVLREKCGCPTTTTTSCGGLTFPSTITATFSGFDASYDARPLFLGGPSKTIKLGDLNGKAAKWINVVSAKGLGTINDPDSQDATCAYVLDGEGPEFEVEDHWGADTTSRLFRIFTGQQGSLAGITYSVQGVLGIPPENWYVRIVFEDNDNFDQFDNVVFYSKYHGQVKTALVPPAFDGAQGVTLQIPGVTPDPSGTITFS